MPPWPAVLAVVADPDDESFGLGAIIDKMAAAGAAAHVLCYTRGEASTLNQAEADLIRQRARELRQAGETQKNLRTQPHGLQFPLQFAQPAGVRHRVAFIAVTRWSHFCALITTERPLPAGPRAQTAGGTHEDPGHGGRLA
ncbi:MAG TPA: PIG-L family deacetylase [Streptosporangiaceae bacterium]|nr:PIG-L family deacetylase [Streptosporangiaceae bacterium]